MHATTDPSERLVKVEPRGQIGNEDTNRCVVIVHQRLPAVLKDHLVVVAGAPCIERVNRLEAVVEMRREHRCGLVVDLRERHTDVVGQVNEQLALPARVEDRREPAGGRSAPIGEKQGARCQFIERLDRQHAIALEQRLVRSVVTGNRARVTQCELGCFGRAARFQCHDGHVSVGRFFQRRDEALGLAHRFDEERDHSRALLLEGVVHVVSGRRDQFLPRRDRQVEAELLVVPQQGGEHRARLGNQGDASFFQLIRPIERKRPEPLFDVVEAHAVSADNRQVGRRCHVANPRPQ